jgi:hypothetical protein
MKMHEAKATNYVQSPTEDDMLELWHRSLIQLNVKGVRTLQKIISDKTLANSLVSHLRCFVKCTLKTNNGLRSL